MIFIAGETYKVTRVVRIKYVNSQNYTNPIVLFFKFIRFLNSHFIFRVFNYMYN